MSTITVTGAADKTGNTNYKTHDLNASNSLLLNMHPGVTIKNMADSKRLKRGLWCATPNRK